MPARTRPSRPAMAITAFAFALALLAATPALLADDCTNRAGFPGAHPPAGPIATSVALGDLDADGDLDMAVANEGGNDATILLNRGDATFAPGYDVGAGSLPSFVTLGDLDGDADLDMVVVNALADSFSVMLNNGDATFAFRVNYPATPGPTSCALGDLDADGDLDIAVAASGSAMVVRLNDGHGAFGAPSSFPAGTGVRFIALGDLDADGDLDAAAVNEFSDNLSILKNNGNATFAPRVNYSSGPAPVSVAIADVDADLDNDVVLLAFDSAMFSVLKNTGDGTLAPRVNYELDDSPASLALGDLDADADLDAVVAMPQLGQLGVLLNNGSGVYAAPVGYFADEQTSSVALGDINGDGHIDAALANRESDNVTVLSGAGDGTFIDPVPHYGVGAFPQGVAHADVDLDGDDDIVTANAAGTASVLLNTGDGSFSAAATYPAGIQPSAVALGDLNADDLPDMVVTNAAGNNVSVLMNLGGGVFGAPTNFATGQGPVAVAMGDFDADSDLDVVVANATTDNVSVLLNTGSGALAPAVHYAVGDRPTSIAVGNLDADGTLDLLVTNYNSNNFTVLKGAGDGTFAPHVTPSGVLGPWSAALADIDRDADLDVVIATSGRPGDLRLNIAVLLNFGNATFASPVDRRAGRAARSVALADVDLDGFPDIITANADGHNVSVMHNVNGTTLFTPRLNVEAGDSPIALTIADLNADGAPDIAVANGTVNQASVLLNIGTFSPQFPDPPRNVNACPGESATLSAGTAGTLPLTFQWRKDGVEIPGAIAATYEIASVSQADAGVYEVVASNGCATVTSPPTRLVLSGFETSESARLFASTPAPFDQRFGSACAISGDTALIGAHNSAGARGSAYVLVRSGNAWAEQAILLASDGAGSDRFAFSLALEGDTAVLGAPENDSAGGDKAGAAYVFTRDSKGQWTEVIKLTASDATPLDYFGKSVAISGDTIVVGADGVEVPGDGDWGGQAYVFVRDAEGEWTQQAVLSASNRDGGDVFGSAVAIDADTIAIGAHGTSMPGSGSAGSVYIFTRSKGVWTERIELIPDDRESNDNFGSAVALRAGTLVAGAERDTTERGVRTGSAYIFTGANDAWTQRQRLTAFDAFPEDNFGSHVAFDGDTILCGVVDDGIPARIPGAAYVFRHVDGAWLQLAKLTPSDGATRDDFGVVAVDGSTAIIGAWGDDSVDGGSYAGSAYVYDLTDLPCCPADWNRDGITNSTDVSDFINDWFLDQQAGTQVTDWDHNGVANSTDVSEYINAWFEDTAGLGCG